jgi:hypothetical protein
MFNPFDGATFLTGTVLMSALGIITGNSPVAATAVGALITGTFVLAAKLIEIYVRSRTDRRVKTARERIAELERQLGK